MAEPPVVNASPLIHLSHVGQLLLLQLLGHDIIVPSSVLSEIKARGGDNATERGVVESAWLRVVPSPPTPDVVEVWDLGPGESAVLAWALSHPGSLAVLDDLQARRCAASLGLRVIGTLGVVLRAKQIGWVPSARAVVMEMVSRGMVSVHQWQVHRGAA